MVYSRFVARISPPLSGRPTWRSFSSKPQICLASFVLPPSLRICSRDAAATGYMRRGTLLQPHPTHRVSQVTRGGGIQTNTPQLLSLPNGLHLTKIAVHWNGREDDGSTCSDTLECLEITSRSMGVFPSSTDPPGNSPLGTGPQGLDLSKVKEKLNLVLRCEAPKIKWVIDAPRCGNKKSAKPLWCYLITSSLKPRLRDLFVQDWRNLTTCW
jgi:hypothetical protein